MESIKIILFSIFAACVYGISQDMVTAHVCTEYFLPPAHPIIFPSGSPVHLALIWGVVATWWVGLLLGIPLAAACRVGRRPKLVAKDVVRPVLCLLATVFVAAMLFGVVGYAAGRMGWVYLLPPIADAVAPERHALFLFNLWAHSAAYALGAVGGGVVMFRLWMKRRERNNNSRERSASGVTG